YSSGDSRGVLTARIALASVTSFLLALALGPLAIRWLKGRFRERIDSASQQLNALHASKSDTPTMGGLFVVGAVALATLLWGDLGNRYVQLGLIAAVGFGSLGAVDDWIKLSTRRNGLSVRQKLAGQIALSLIIAALLYVEHRDTPQGLELLWPIGGGGVWLGAGFIAWGLVVLVGSSNAVNLTDGLDGLAGGCTVFAGSAFVALAYLAGHHDIAEYLSVPFMPGCGELAVVLAALVGAMLGFLWFNCHPAQVFMGDAGSLPVGALLALGALATRQEALLVIVGGVFVLETFSVILQVGWFRMTGRRLIACSPLHNHFLFRGQQEFKIVVRFWIGSALLAIIAVASLKIR
ncbi:MAG: phospho-N-acetylmuramoyl-pentapeptide-transferase, partial [Planctomycetaceae bacterium]